MTSTRLFSSALLSLLLVGCIENELDNKPGPNTSFDTSSNYEPPVDTANEENTDDIIYWESPICE